MKAFLLAAGLGTRLRPITDTTPKCMLMIDERPELLGSAGTLRANRQWVAGEDVFLACYADNLTDFDLRSLVSVHSESGGIATLSVFHSDRPWTGGVVELDETGTVIGFVEKPSKPVSDLTNAVHAGRDLLR